MSDTLSDTCQLCGSGGGLSLFDVPPGAAITTCAVCGPQLASGASLDANHWYCLQESIWSETPAVQVVSWRLAKQLAATQTWAQDLLDQAYLEESVLEWAQDGLGGASSDAAPTVDSNGTPLADGDSVTLIKDLDVKGGGFTAKRGTLVKNIRLTDDPKYVEGKVNKVAIVLVAAYLKKAS